IHSDLRKRVRKSISSTTLEDFRQFNLALMRSLLEYSKQGNWIGWAPLSLYEHMIREIEYLQIPHTKYSILRFWLIDMEGHSALDAAWTDPSNADIVKKATQLNAAYAELSKRMGE